MRQHWYFLQKGESREKLFNLGSLKGGKEFDSLPQSKSWQASFIWSNTNYPVMDHYFILYMEWIIWKCWDLFIPFQVLSIPVCAPKEQIILLPEKTVGVCLPIVFFIQHLLLTSDQDLGSNIMEASWELWFTCWKRCNCFGLQRKTKQR